MNFDDFSVPILFLDLCGLGTLLDFVKNLNRQLSTEDNNKLFGFSQDVTAGLKHLHSNQVKLCMQYYRNTG